MNLLKILAFLSVTPSALVHAVTATDQIYGAIDVGVFQAHFNSHYDDQSDVIPQNISDSFPQDGYTAGFAMGLTHPLNASCSLGLELSANVDSHSALFQSGAANTAFSDRIKMRHHVDLTFVPAWILSDSFSSYLKLGLSDASIRDKLISPVGYNPVMIQYSSHKNVYGFAGALGVKHWVDKHRSLFAEANFHDYGQFNLNNFQNFSADYTHTARLCTYGLVAGAAYAMNI